MKAEVSEKYLIDNYSTALMDRRASMLIGAGLSRDADLVDWRSLLRGIAEDLDLDIDEEYDLVAVAQYHHNLKGRTRINNLIIKEFLKDAKITENHRLIARYPLTEIWTTNYDTLIEDAITEAGKTADIKRRSQDLSNSVPDADVVVYKMHGDAKDSDDAVITKDDYETYNEPTKRQSFSLSLQGQLISNSFLFLGFSFTDPNIEYILSRVRALVGLRAGSEHYYITKRPTPPKPFTGKVKDRYIREVAKLEHRIFDLKRFNINTCLVDKFEDITSILKEINRRIHLKNIFVSGSAKDYSPLGRHRIDDLSYKLGLRIIKEGFNLVSGFGFGIGTSIISGAIEEVYRNNKAQISERTVLRPFPKGILDATKRKEISTQYRKDMISQAGYAVFICGNKDDEKGNTINGAGVLEEFKIASDLGVCPIPIGATGYVAAKIWETVTNKYEDFYTNLHIKTELNVLNDPNKTNDEYLDAIFSIINKNNSRGGK